MPSRDQWFATFLCFCPNNKAFEEEISYLHDLFLTEEKTVAQKGLSNYLSLRATFYFVLFFFNNRPALAHRSHWSPVSPSFFSLHWGVELDGLSRSLGWALGGRGSTGLQEPTANPVPHLAGVGGHFFFFFATSSQSCPVGKPSWAGEKTRASCSQWHFLMRVTCGHRMGCHKYHNQGDQVASADLSILPPLNCLPFKFVSNFATIPLGDK